GRENPFPALYEELELLVSRAGLSPAEAIRAATRTAAAAAGAGEEMGVIAPGRLADFVLVAANPLDDIRNLRTILFTVKRGRRFDRADFRPISRREMPDED
ncbi:MAG TPA: amidohydrolase family protein, partial [Allosphingosinicella sp.]|nr:amidohydrolase family protein [Allosphingosinicella sp.]